MSEPRRWIARYPDGRTAEIQVSPVTRWLWRAQVSQPRGNNSVYRETEDDAFFHAVDMLSSDYGPGAVIEEVKQ